MPTALESDPSVEPEASWTFAGARNEHSPPPLAGGGWGEGSYQQTAAWSHKQQL
jgi:hypothetical protein